MGGQIKVHAVKDKGSKFWFVLPITPVRINGGNDILNIAADASGMMVDNQFKNSKATENGSTGQQNGDTSYNQKMMYHEESYESKDLDVDDIYESDENQQGIPANLAMTSHMMNENILLSFFPPQLHENPLIAVEEEIKNNIDASEYYHMVSKRKNRNGKDNGQLENNSLQGTINNGITPKLQQMQQDKQSILNYQ
jgi:hypothetical protein